MTLSPALLAKIEESVQLTLSVCSDPEVSLRPNVESWAIKAAIGACKLALAEQAGEVERLRKIETAAPEKAITAASNVVKRTIGNEGNIYIRVAGESVTLLSLPVEEQANVICKWIDSAVRAAIGEGA